MLIAGLCGGGWLLWERDGGGGAAGTEEKAPTAGANSGGVRETVEKSPANSRGELLYRIASPRLPVAEVTQSPGTWATERTFAKTLDSEVVGYRAERGKQVWKIPLSGVVCAAARHVTDDGLTAVVFETGRRKNEQLVGDVPGAVLSIDPATGKEKVLLTAPDLQDVGMLLTPRSTEMAYEHGRLYSGAPTVYGPSEPNVGPGLDKMPVAIALGGR
ncbi:hypothetical protein [Streptomyces sp. NPDC051219]|uniref:hypothetical protein n=1 Tax=Streptomyces sp. NPDC051219 TaxID=3155283 RepID=UPI003420DDCE